MRISARGISRPGRRSGATRPGIARAFAKADLIVAGSDVFKEVFLAFDPALAVTIRRADGEKALKGELLAEITGRLASILTAERVALNLFQRMCGIATLTRRYVDRVAGTQVRILDTRKTAPGLRILDKYAVRIGGGYNHRFALYDGVLIKDNHIAAAGGIREAVRRVRGRIPHTLKIEVEVRIWPNWKRRWPRERMQSCWTICRARRWPGRSSGSGEGSPSRPRET